MTVTIIIVSLLLAFSGNVAVYLYIEHSLISAAREGARAASLNPDLINGTGADAVKQRVITFVETTSGITLTNDEITVTPPDVADPQGARDVQVSISHDVPLPLGPGKLLAAMGVAGAADIDTIPAGASAIMRYEE